MIGYRVFTFDEDTHLMGVPMIVEAENDQAAIEAANQVLNGHALEVWAVPDLLSPQFTNRRIARLEPNGIAPVG